MLLKVTSLHGQSMRASAGAHHAASAFHTLEAPEDLPGHLPNLKVTTISPKMLPKLLKNKVVLGGGIFKQ
eukprot:2087115-Amphidinium_carterae.1